MALVTLMGFTPAPWNMTFGLMPIHGADAAN